MSPGLSDQHPGLTPYIGTSHKVRYQATYAAHSVLFSHVGNPEGNVLTGDSSTKTSPHRWITPSGDGATLTVPAGAGAGQQRSPQERAASSNTPAAPTSLNDGPLPAAERVRTGRRGDEASALTCRREHV